MNLQLSEYEQTILPIASQKKYAKCVTEYNEALQAVKNNTLEMSTTSPATLVMKSNYYRQMIVKLAKAAESVKTRLTYLVIDLKAEIRQLETDVRIQWNDLTASIPNQQILNYILSQRIKNADFGQLKQAKLFQ